MTVVQLSEIELAAPRSVAVSSTEAEISPTRLGRTRRTSLFIVPTSAGVVVTISKGDLPAVQNAGYVLQQGQAYVEADGDNFNCYQGAVHAVSSAGGNIAIVEVFAVQ